MNPATFRPSAYSAGEYGAIIPVVLGAYYAGKYTISAAAEAYAEELNEKYDFTSVKPEEALEQIGLGENKFWIAATIGQMGPAANRVQKPPTDLAQAYVKSAYLMAIAGRYLQNPGLIVAARAQLNRLQTLKQNSNDTGAITFVMRQAWGAVSAVAGSRVDDPQLRALSIYFGERPKGGTSLLQMVADQQRYKLDPTAEGQAVKDALTPEGPEAEKKKRKSKKQREKARRARARKRRLMVYGGVGTVAVLGLALLAFKGV